MKLWEKELNPQLLLTLLLSFLGMVLLCFVAWYYPTAMNVLIAIASVISFVLTLFFLDDLEEMPELVVFDLAVFLLGVLGAIYYFGLLPASP